MNIGRRSFLSFLIGGAAGTALSPLPWKLTDDLSIWSQNWPWTPIPARGEVSLVHTTCTLCPGGCGISVRKVGERCVKIEGIQGHPVNDGGVCPLGASGLQLLYGPARIRTPLKRVGERGQGRWTAISWEDALAETAAKLSALRDEGKSHAVACLSGRSFGTMPALLQRFMAAYGSPNFMTVPSMRDSYTLTLATMNGQAAMAGFDVEHTDFLLSFGSGIIDGWGSPVRMFQANSHWRSGAGKVVQAESRLSNTAAKSDIWAPITPGTEAALALGVAHVIILEKRYRGDFVNNHTTGFDTFRTMVAGYSPDKVAQITGVEKNTIVSLARSFARASRPLAICGRGRGEVPGSMNEFMAVHALNALVGGINRPGGIWALPEPDYIQWPEPDMDAVATAGNRNKRLDGAVRNAPVGSLPNRFFSAVAAGKGYPIEALFISGTNPDFSLPNNQSMGDAWANIPFVVSFSSRMDETAKQADLILPDHAYLERYEDVPAPLGFHKPITGLCQPAIAPQFNTIHTGDVVIQLAQTLGGTTADAFPWDDYETCLQETLGDRWDTLVENGYVVDEGFSPAPWPEQFGTQKFNFAVTGIRTGFLPVPIEGDESTYPLILMPYDSMRVASGAIGNTPFMTKAVDENVLLHGMSFVQVNPATAGALGLRHGDKAVLTTPAGQAEVRTDFSEGIMPGVVAIPRGMGRTPHDQRLMTHGINTNPLVSSVEDPISGLEAAWGVRAKLSKA